MHIRLLGTHQGESTEIHYISFLVDGRLAIDAGGLTTNLTLDEQMAVDAVLVTHQHYDHIRDLPALAHTQWEERSLHIYCTEHLRTMLRRHFFNGEIWPTMEEAQGRLHPLNFTEVEAEKPFSVLGYDVRAIEMSHTVPTVGYHVSSGGRSFFYTADTRGDGKPSWASIRPDLLIAEVTMSSRYEELAYSVGHMTPWSLGRELRAFHAQQGYYPRTLCVHVNPRHEAAIYPEIAALAGELQADISVAREGMVVEL